MNDRHAYDQFLFSLVTKFTHRAQPHIRSLWADLMELEEARDAHTLRVVREQTLRRVQALGRAAHAVSADEVEALSRTLVLLVANVTDVKGARHRESFDSLYGKMRELTEALYAVHATPSVVGSDCHPTESELVESYAN